MIGGDFRLQRRSTAAAEMRVTERRESDTATATRFREMGFEEGFGRGREEMFAGKVMAAEVGGGGGAGGEAESGKNGFCLKGGTREEKGYLGCC